jgi:hypothetical protein
VDHKNGWIGIGIGIVVCDHEGVVLATCITTKNVLVELLVSEALIVFNVVDLCKELGFMNIILEGDALQIVNAVKAPGKN